MTFDRVRLVDDHALAAMSRALFKNRYVLPVAAVAFGFTDGHFTKHQIAHALNISDNLVTGPLERLTLADAVKATGVVDVEGQQIERLAHPFWLLVEGLVKPPS